MEVKPKKVRCPKCLRQLAFYDGKGAIDIEVGCYACDILVIFEITKRKTRYVDFPQRNTSSGCRFW